MIKIKKLKNFDVTIKAPPSKAHTLRALIMGALAKGKTKIKNPLLADDQLNVIKCLKSIGVEINLNKKSNIISINGKNGTFSPLKKTLNVGDSGVGMNFLSSLCNLSENKIILTGSKRLCERPIKEVVSGLKQLGCKIDYLKKEGFPPVTVFGNGILGGTTKMSGSKTSQYFSSICTSSPYAKSPVTIECIDELSEKPYLDITIEMMKKFGVVCKNNNYKTIFIPNNKKYIGKEIEIEGDFSSASFFFLIAAVCKSKVTVTGLNLDTKQGDIKFLDILEKMGCIIKKERNKITVEGKFLKAVTFDMNNIPDLVPPIAVAAAFAEGKSKFTGIGHLIHKESNRLSATVCELNKMGVTAMCDDDSLIVEGCKHIHGATIDPHNDHRLAMSFGVAGLIVKNQIIENEKCVAKSFPYFWKELKIFTD